MMLKNTQFASEVMWPPETTYCTPKSGKVYFFLLLGSGDVVGNILPDSKLVLSFGQDWD